MAMALGETITNNRIGYHSVVSQNDLLWTLENGLAVWNVSDILKTYFISFCETTDR